MELYRREGCGTTLGSLRLKELHLEEFGQSKHPGFSLSDYPPEHPPHFELCSDIVKINFTAMPTIELVTGIDAVKLNVYFAALVS